MGDTRGETVCLTIVRSVPSGAQLLCRREGAGRPSEGLRCTAMKMTAAVGVLGAIGRGGIDPRAGRRTSSSRKRNLHCVRLLRSQRQATRSWGVLSCRQTVWSGGRKGEGCEGGGGASGGILARAPSRAQRRACGRSEGRAGRRCRTGAAAGKWSSRRARSQMVRSRATGHKRHLGSRSLSGKYYGSDDDKEIF